MKVINCAVTSIEALTSNVHKVLLKPEVEIAFNAGQYLQVIMGENDKRPFSIASTPSQHDLIELHIGANPNNGYAFEVLTRCQEAQQISVELPLGNAYVRHNSCPAIIVAGGTGYSYAKSIVMDSLQQQPERDLTLYWGAKEITDLYEAQILEQLAQQYANFTFVPVLENPPAIWNGLTGWVHRAVMFEHPNLSAYEVYAAGRFEMAATIRDDFLPLGLEKTKLYGDAYAFI